MRLAKNVLLLISGTQLIAEAPKNQSLTFRVSGVECGSCMYAVQQSISETKGVKDVVILPGIETLATVSFDPILVSEHQIAQSIREALPLHGTPYLASLKIQIQKGTAPDMTKSLALLRKMWATAVRIEPVDKEPGNYLLHFESLKTETQKPAPRGWNLKQFTTDAKEAGLTLSLISEGQ